MSQSLATTAEQAIILHDDSTQRAQFVTMYVGQQLLGIPVRHVQDVLKSQRITPVPLAPDEVVGSLNLRGRVVTALDLGRKLGLHNRYNPDQHMSVVINHDEQLYSFLIDRIGDVLTLPLQGFEKAPPNLEANMSDVAAGVFQLEKSLMVVLDIERLLTIEAV